MPGFQPIPSTSKAYEQSTLENITNVDSDASESKDKIDFYGWETSSDNEDDGKFSEKWMNKNHANLFKNLIIYLNHKYSIKINTILYL